MATKITQTIKKRIRKQEKKLKDIKDEIDKAKQINDTETADLEIQYTDAKSKLLSWMEAYDVKPKHFSEKELKESGFESE